MTNKNQDGPAVSSSINLNNVIDDIKEVLVKHENPKHILKEYLNSIESKIDTERMLKIHEVNREHIKNLILSHPYFRNPNDYGIRLVSIMKFLKKKGVDVSIPDIDILVDEIINTIDDIEVIEFGKYKKNNEK